MVDLKSEEDDGKEEGKVRANAQRILCDANIQLVA